MLVTLPLKAWQQTLKSTVYSVCRECIHIPQDELQFNQSSIVKFSCTEEILQEVEEPL